MRALPFVALLALAGCSFDAETPDIHVIVDGITQTENVDHLDVTLLKPDGTTATYRPSFQPQSLTSLELSLSSGGAAGVYTVSVAQEVSHSNTIGATSTVVVTVPQVGPEPHIAPPAP